MLLREFNRLKSLSYKSAWTPAGNSFPSKAAIRAKAVGKINNISQMTGRVAIQRVKFQRKEK